MSREWAIWDDCGDLLEWQHLVGDSETSENDKSDVLAASKRVAELVDARRVDERRTDAGDGARHRRVAIA